MKKTFLVFLFFLSGASQAQLSRLNFTVSNSDVDVDSVCYRLCITGHSDTIADKFIYTEFHEKFDSLSPGDYKVHLYSCADLNELSMNKNIILIPEKSANIQLEVSSSENYTLISHGFLIAVVPCVSDFGTFQALTANRMTSWFSYAIEGRLNS